VNMRSVVIPNKPAVIAVTERETDADGRHNSAHTTMTSAPAPKNAHVSM